MTVPDTDIDIVKTSRNSSLMAQDAFLNGVTQVLDQYGQEKSPQQKKNSLLSYKEHKSFATLNDMSINNQLTDGDEELRPIFGAHNSNPRSMSSRL